MQISGVTTHSSTSWIQPNAASQGSFLSVFYIDILSEILILDILIYCSQGLPPSLESCFPVLRKILNSKSSQSQKQIFDLIPKAQKPKSKNWIYLLGLRKILAIFCLCFREIEQKLGGGFWQIIWTVKTDHFFIWSRIFLPK